MKTIQIIRFCASIIFALLSGWLFHNATISELPWAIILSVMGTITAIIAITAEILFIKEYKKGFTFFEDYKAHTKIYHSTPRKEIISPEEFENENPEMIAAKIIDYSVLNFCGNMTKEDKFFYLKPAKIFCEFYIKYVLDFVRNKNRKLNSIDHFFGLITSDPDKVIKMTVNFNQKDNTDVFKNAPECFRPLLDHAYGIKNIYEDIDLDLYRENGAHPECFIPDSVLHIKGAIHSHTILLLQRPLKQQAENIPAEVKEGINKLLNN